MGDTTEEIRRSVYRFLADDFGIDYETMLEPGKTLADLNQDGLDIIEMFCVFDDEFGVDADDKLITESSTVAELAEYLIAELSKAGVEV